MTYLIDTDIIIYGIKNHPNVGANFQKRTGYPKTISVITYGELIHGAKKSQNIHRNIAKVHQISQLFPVVNVNKAVMETFGDIKAYLQKKGKVIDDMDLIIAATALTMDYTLVTNNEKHFARIPDLRIENWARDNI